MKGIIFAVISLIAASQSLAHGMSDAGPHGGEIQMPGAFHTEVLYSGPTGFAVYLLDINLSNPIVEKSAVEAKIDNGKKTYSLQCSARSEKYFFCSGALRPDTKKGKLIVKATRDSAAGNEAVYELPLKFSKQ